MNKTMLKQRYDLAIIGGGLVGAGLALALKNAPINIILIDATLPKENDSRLFALNQTSCQFLKNIGAFYSLEKLATPIKKIHLSKKRVFGAIRLSAEEAGLASLGAVIPACHIEAEFNQLLLKQANLTIIRPATLLRLSSDHENTLEVICDNQTHMIQASFLAAADGSHSTVRALMNIQTEEHDYQQSALVTRTTIQASHQHIAYERFVNDETIAMLPLGDNQCATIWSGPTKKIARLHQATDTDFMAELQQSFGERLGKIAGITSRSIFPLRKIIATKRGVNRVILLGNAAHTLHPIAAQGFNLSIYEVAVFAESLLATLTEKNIINAETLLKSFLEKTADSINLEFSHYLSGWCHSSSTLFSALTQLGFIGMDVATPLKKLFIEKMLGLRGYTPRLLLNASHL